MKIKLVPKSLITLKELSSWMNKNVLDTDTVIGIRRDCKITRIKELSYHGPRWTTVGGVSIYYNP